MAANEKHGYIGQEAAGHDLPPGWQPGVDRAMPIHTPRGLLARSGMMRGRCDTGECRRRIDIDLHAWLARGKGDHDLAQLARAYRCGSPKCGLRFDPEFFPKGLPLLAFTASEERLALTCATCRRTRSLTAEELILALVQRRMGSGNTGVNEVADKLRAPCAQCGKRRWLSELKRPAAYGTPGYAAPVARTRLPV